MWLGRCGLEQRYYCAYGMFKELGWNKCALKLKYFYSCKCTQGIGTYNVQQWLPKWSRVGFMDKGWIGKGNKW
jgi:hypothetical protein